MDKTQLITVWQEMPWNDIKLKANKVLPKFVVVVFIILIAKSFAELTWEFFTPAQEAVSNTFKNQNGSSIPAASNASLKKVASYHLFGNAKQQAVVQQKVIDAPETRLRLDLKGVFASTNTQQALAIISSSKSQDKTYRIGEMVTPGVSLHAVYADRVILKRNGRFETLRLPKPKLENSAIYNSNIVDHMVESTKLSNTLSVTSPAITQSASSSQRLRKMRDTLVNDPAKIWKEVRINPVMKEGQVQGYTLVHNDQALMKALNIRKTDIITEINGEPLSNPATLYGLIGSLSSQQSLDLTIERNGQQQSIQLTF